MAHGVAEVQDHPDAGVPFILLHHLPLDIAAGIEHGLNVLHDRRPGGVGAEKIEERPVPDAAVLDDLGHAVGKGLVIQCTEARGVHENQPGLPEGASQVLACREVDGHLAPHGGVHLGQKCGGNLYEVHATQDGGRGEARQIAHHAAPQGHHAVGAGEPLSREGVV